MFCTNNTLLVRFAVAAGAGAGTPTPGPTTEPTPAPTTPPTTGPAPTPTTAPVAGSHHLAETGVDATPAFVAGIAALLLGLGMTVARLRRRTAAK